MLTYSFDKKGKESLYEFLYKQIKADISCGKIGKGERLPSKRALAENLNISVITVENAYSQLAAEGYIYSRAKSGFYVADVPLPPPAKSPPQPRQIKKEPEYPCFADLTGSDSTKKSFPFDTWSRLMRETLASDRNRLTERSPSQGVYELRKAIADHLFQFRGIQVQADSIVIGAGTEYLYGLIIQLLGRNKKYALEDPGYEKTASIYHANGVEYVSIPMEKDGISIKELERSDADVLHISPSHHFPTGTVTSIGKRYELLRRASAKGRYIIEDDYDSEFRLTGKPVPTMQSIDTEGRVIYINTFSKSLTPTIRISYMVLPEELMQLYRQSLGFYSCTVSTFEQYTLAKFIDRGYFEKHINRMRTFYRGERDRIMQYIKKHPCVHLATIKEEHSGLHFLLKLETRLSDELLKQRALERGVNIRCLSDYYKSSPQRHPHTLIVNYSSATEENTERAIDILFSIISE